MKLRMVAMVLALCALASAPIGCGDDDTGAQDGTSSSGAKGSAGGGADAGSSKDAGSKASDDELEVAGDWKSDFGEQSISLDDWDGAKVVSFDNDENVAITHTPDDAQYNPDTYSKLVWTEPSDAGFYYCTVDFGLESQKAAEDSDKVADDSDPANSGCGMFMWTKLAPR